MNILVLSYSRDTAWVSAPGSLLCITVCMLAVPPRTQRAALTTEVQLECRPLVRGQSGTSVNGARVHSWCMAPPAVTLWNHWPYLYLFCRSSWHCHCHQVLSQDAHSGHPQPSGFTAYWAQHGGDVKVNRGNMLQVKHMLTRFDHSGPQPMDSIGETKCNIWSKSTL